MARFAFSILRQLRYYGTGANVCPSFPRIDNRRVGVGTPGQTTGYGVEVADSCAWRCGCQGKDGIDSGYEHGVAGKQSGCVCVVKIGGEVRQYRTERFSKSFKEKSEYSFSAMMLFTITSACPDVFAGESARAVFRPVRRLTCHELEILRVPI